MGKQSVPCVHDGIFVFSPHSPSPCGTGRRPLVVNNVCIRPKWCFFGSNVDRPSIENKRRRQNTACMQRGVRVGDPTLGVPGFCQRDDVERLLATAGGASAGSSFCWPSCGRNWNRPTHAEVYPSPLPPSGQRDARPPHALLSPATYIQRYVFMQCTVTTGTTDGKLCCFTVPFWFRETQLKPYQKAYRIVDDGDRKYTPMEKSLMTSCVCTVGTKYADVAAQLFTAKVCRRRSVDLTSKCRWSGGQIWVAMEQVVTGTLCFVLILACEEQRLRRREVRREQPMGPHQALKLPLLLGSSMRLTQQASALVRSPTDCHTLR